jgi:hypothetical protein
MIKSQAKWAYYILILSALAYVIMMALSLDNTRHIREGWTPDLAKFSGKQTTSTNSKIEAVNAGPESEYQQTIGAFRDNLDGRLNDFIANPPDTTDTTRYTTILWTTLATVLLFAVFSKME